MPVDELLDGLTEPQRAAVTHGEGPLLVLAGPGSGKTRVITHRAAYLACTQTRPRHILTITFTNKAANEMAERMSRLKVARGVTCSTFHSFCARLLRIHGERAGISPNFSIFDESDQEAAVRLAIEQRGLSTTNFPPGRMLNVISRAKNDMILAHEYASRATGWQDGSLAAVYAAYEQILAAQNALDFDDLLVKTALLLGNDPELRGRLQDQYRFVLVDEYQDTNHAQYLIARGLALAHENLCVTGDPDQSIYAWRGANLNNILQFEQDFPKAKVVRLEENFRSTPEILAAADAVIRRNRKRKKKTLFTSNKGGSLVRVIANEDQSDEARMIASEIQRHVAGGGRYGDAAVFYRTNALSRTLEAALREATIPYQIARGVAFYQRKEIKDVLAYLKVIVNPLDQVSLERIINTPPRGLGRTAVERLLNHASNTGRPALELAARPEQIPAMTTAGAKALRAFADLMAGLAAAARGGGVQHAVERVIHDTGIEAVHREHDDDSARENINELVSAAANYDRQHGDDGSLADWLVQVALVSDLDAIDPDVGAVTLMTLHAAKGLEFNTVFMVGLEDGILPHRRSQEERGGDIEEERRLCFVGMTRARRNLTLSYARWREIRGISQRTIQSPFLHELPDDGIEWLDVAKDGRNRYDEGPEEDPPPADFQEWREGQVVRHPDYGIGRLVSLEPFHRGTRARIRFEACGEVTMILEFSKLEMVEYYDTE